MKFLRRRRPATPTNDEDMLILGEDRPEVEDPKQPKAKTKGKTKGATGLAAYAAYEHLVATTDGVWAYYALDEVPWLFKEGDTRAATMAQFSHSLYELSGYNLKWLGVPNPFPKSEWARALDMSTQGRRIKAAGCTTFEDYQQTTEGKAFAAHLARSQDYITRHGTRKRENVLAVQVTPRRIARNRDDLALLTSPDRLEGKHGALEPVRATLRRINTVITGNPDGIRDTYADKGALSGVPMTANGMGWLWYATAAMGMPVPTGLLTGGRTGWDEDEIQGFTNTVHPSQGEMASTTELRSVRLVEAVAVVDGHEVIQPSMQEVVKHVTVAHARVIRDRSSEDMHNNRMHPWLHFLTTLPFDTYFLLAGEILEPEKLEGDAERAAGTAIDLGEHNAEHGLRADVRQERAVENALEYERSVRDDPGEVATRFRGVVMVAVTGESEDDVMETRLAPLVSKARRTVGVELVTQRGQYASYRSFIPGEPVILSGSVVQAKLPVLAASMPHIDTGLGDKTGIALGPIAGSKDLCIFDLHGGPRRNTSGMVFVMGEQGSGKSKLIGVLAEFSVNELGVPTYLNDPSGPAERLATVPWLTKHTRVIDLAANSAKAGLVTPSVLVPEPKRAHYENDDDWKVALRSAEQERREMLRDVLMMLQPTPLVESEQGAHVQSLLFEAVYEAAGEYGRSPWDVVDYLTKIGEKDTLARTVAKALTVESQQLGGRQVFPERRADGASDAGIDMLDGNLLTIIKLSGIKIPDSRTPRREWDSAERASQPLLYLSSRFATRAMYLDKGKGTILNDEMGLLEGSTSVASMAARTSVDSRKWNKLVVYGTQNPGTLYRLAPQITNLAGAMFIGKMRSDEAAKAGLELAGAPTGQGAEQTLLTMARGNFIMRDWDMRIGHMMVDRQLLAPEVDEATNTTPDDGSDEYTYDVRFEGVNA